MTPDEVDEELLAIRARHVERREIGLLEALTQAFAVGCRYRAAVEELKSELEPYE